MGAGRLSGDPDAMGVMDSVAVVPGGEWEKVGKTYPEIVSGPIPMTQQAGPLIFLTGYSGRDQANFPIVTFDQLRDHGKLMGLAHYDDPESETMMCQAWHIYRTYQRLLKEAGSDISRVVHQVLYLVDVSKLAALERVARVIYDGKVPPTTVIGADEIGPVSRIATGNRRRRDSLIARARIVRTGGNHADKPRAHRQPSTGARRRSRHPERGAELQLRGGLGLGRPPLGRRSVRHRAQRRRMAKSR